MRAGFASTSLLVAVLMAGCGGSDEPDYGDPITVDSATMSSLNSAIESATSFSTIENTPGDNSALSKIGTLYSAMAVLPTVCQAHASKPEGAEAHEALMKAWAGKPVDTTCLTVTTNKVTYNACNFGSGTMNGTISWGNNTFSIDIDMSVTAGGATTTISESGSITVSGAGITGGLSIAVNSSIGATTVKATYTADYDVTLSSGCATGGKIEFSAKGNASTSGGSGSYSFGIKAEFGPTCGSVKLYCAK